MPNVSVGVGACVCVKGVWQVEIQQKKAQKLMKQYSTKTVSVNQSIC